MGRRKRKDNKAPSQDDIPDVLDDINHRTGEKRTPEQ